MPILISRYRASTPTSYITSVQQTITEDLIFLADYTFKLNNTSDVYFKTAGTYSLFYVLGSIIGFNDPWVVSVDVSAVTPARIASAPFLDPTGTRILVTLT